MPRVWIPEKTQTKKETQSKKKVDIKNLDKTDVWRRELPSSDDENQRVSTK